MDEKCKNGSVVCIGTFDGVHRGHVAILKRVNEIASEDPLDLERVAYSFILPPRFETSGSKRGLLIPEDIKVKILLRHVDRVERVRFADVSDITAERFVSDTIIGRLNARAIVVGDRFRFGRGRSGDIAKLREICEPNEVFVASVSSQAVDGSLVSSTRIRRLLAEGMIESAAALLGHPPLLVGHVVHGDGLGRELGYPTANIAVGSRIIIPPDGIYLVHAFWNGNRSAGLLYIGTRPTLGDGEARCEVHLLSPPTYELYEHTVEVQLLRKLRDDRTFASLADLKQQMAQDVKQALAIHATWNEAGEPMVA